PAGALEEAPASGRKVVVDHRRVDRQPLVGDDVDVGPVAGGQDAAVVQADGAGRLPALAAHGLLHGQLTAGAVAAPVGEEEGGEAGVTDGPHVGAAVAESGNRDRVLQHLAHGVERAVGEVQR